MTEGHPGFVANNGRIGYGLDDFAAYAPETGSTVRLVWLAARREKARLSLGAGLTEDELYAGELDDATRATFDERLTESGARPRGVPAPAAAPVAVDQQGGGHLRARRGPRRTWCTSARVPTTTARSSRSARSSTPRTPSATT